MTDHAGVSVGETLGTLMMPMVISVAGLIGGWAMLSAGMGFSLEVVGGGGLLGLDGRVNLLPFAIFSCLFVLVASFASAEAEHPRRLTWVPFGAGLMLFSSGRVVAGDETASTLRLVGLVMMLFVVDFVLAAHARSHRSRP